MTYAFFASSASISLAERATAPLDQESKGAGAAATDQGTGQWCSRARRDGPGCDYESYAS